MAEDRHNIIVFLKQYSIFHDLSETDIDKYMCEISVVSYSHGIVILEQGQTPDRLYIVQSGLVEGSYLDRYGVKTPLFTLSAGDYFGDMPVLTNKPSQIGFCVVEDAKVVAVPKTVFLCLLSNFPQLSQRVFSEMSERQFALANRLSEIRKRHLSTKAIMKTMEEEAPFLVGKTRIMHEIWQKIPEIASSPCPLLIKGEFGSGKELVAGIIHSKSPLRNRPFIIMDASDISKEDWEEGTSDDPLGFASRNLQLPYGGTLLLKNIDALAHPLQEALRDFLNAWIKLSEGKGLSSRVSRYNDLPQIRIIFTTHTGLEESLAQGRFDPGLYEILSHNIISLPPLRERKIDILGLAMHFMARHSDRYKKKVDKLSRRARELLLGYDYRRGNIQELDEVIERGVVLAATDTIRSEQLFLGAPAGKAHIWYNLLNIKPFESIVRKGIYPGVFRWVAAAFFFFIMFSCFFGPQDPARNWGTILVWWIWWPWLCIAAFFIGRTWCSFCAYSTIGSIVQKRLKLNLRFPKFLKDYDYLLATVFFLFIVWAEEASNMRHRPVYTGILLTSILSLEVLFSILFPRETWCRHVCPMGNLIGVFAMSSVVEVRANLDICANQCATHECYHGTGDIPGCPMFQHLMYVDNNQTCKLCLNCIRACPHKAVSLNLRPPGWEIWASERVRPGMAIFVCALMAVLFPVMRPFKSLLLTTIAFLATPALMIGLIWLISLIGFDGANTNGPSLPQRSIKIGSIFGAEEKANAGFWKPAYAYVPLALAAHIAYQLRYLPWLKDVTWTFLFNSRTLLERGHVLHSIQGLFLILGIFFSFYAIIRISKDKIIAERRPNLIYWLGHFALIVLYPLLIWQFLG
ncbi:sigma 54-interacting transcriptional regulator [bacterium]|nr:sigma 54-interacting transcriptional regulator [bacterium]